MPDLHELINDICYIASVGLLLGILILVILGDITVAPGGFSFDWLGTLVSVLFGFLLKAGYDEVRNVYTKFEGECRIKGELEDIATNLLVAGKPNDKINAPFGAEFIRHHPQRLFGEHNREAIGYYTDIFDPYNLKMDTGSYEEHKSMQHSLINHMHGILETGWVKKILSEPSIIEFIRYLLKRDAERTLIPWTVGRTV